MPLCEAARFGEARVKGASQGDGSQFAAVGDEERQRGAAK